MKRWHAEHPGAAVEEKIAARSQLMQAWKELSPAEKAKFARHAQQNVDDPGQDAPLPRGGGPSIWEARIGDGAWPISSASLEHMLDDAPGSKTRTHGGPGTHFGTPKGGVKNRFAPIRELDQTHHLAKSRGDIPREAKFEVKVPCPQIHPGVCVTTDGACYNQIKTIAKALEVYFNKDCTGNFFRLGSPPLAEPMYIFVAIVRQKRYRSNITRVLCMCEPCGEDGRGLRFKPGAASSPFDFQTCWSLAKVLHTRGAASIHIDKVELEQDAAETIAVGGQSFEQAGT
eukprot:3016217-Lingulodinium_polyedra.AAC.1